MKDHFFTFRFIFNSVAGLVIGGLLIFACEQKPSNQSPNSISDNVTASNSDIRHAIGFDLISYEGFKILQIISFNNNEAGTISYLLKEKNAEVPEQFSALKQIEIPVKRIALLHSSYVSFFDFCETKDHIKAISEAKYVYDSSIYSAAEEGLLPEIGYGESLDKERLLELGIEAVVTVGFPNTPNKSRQVLEELGIPVLVFSDWQETTLLGRAEWVKIIAALTDSEALCEEKFNKVETEYARLKSLTSDIDNRPKVICNLPYKSAWYVPGGNSYMSNALNDAGADYMWAETEGTGGVQIDFEVAYANGLKADYWINTDFVNSIDEITDRDGRLADFKPMQNGKVFNNNNRLMRSSANDCWESGLIKPEIILADLIKIFHPELLPAHKFYYYKQVK